MNESIDCSNPQPKNRLAVFEHVTCKKKQSGTAKSYSSKRRNHSSSPVSDTDLVIDDDDYTSAHPQKKRRLGVRLTEEPLKLLCSLEGCLCMFTNYEEFISHINEHTALKTESEGNFACTWIQCAYNTASLMLFRQHLCYHGYHTKLKNIGDNVENRIKLPNCNQPYKTLHPEEIFGYSCDWESCGKRFATIFDFHEHMRLHINSNPKYCKQGEIISCDWRGCSYKFNSQYKLIDHLRSHTKERVVGCSGCGSLFATKTKFYDHRKRQLPMEMQSNQCSQCSKLFPTERLLRDHMRTHINHYKCTMCDMTCPKPSALATHIRYRHIPEKPIKCNQCEYSCVSKQALEMHLNTHRTDDYLGCQECSFRCRTLYALDKHHRNEHTQGWSPVYECHCCLKTFPRGNRLTRHLLKEHNFQWPSGHTRFRYKEDTDGIFRLQTVRYESIEVTQEMMRTNTGAQSPEPGAKTRSKSNKKSQEVSDKKPNNYVLMVTENGDRNVAYATDKSILITISDLDERGNILNCEVVQSNEMKVMEEVGGSAEEGRCLRPRKVNKL